MKLEIGAYVRAEFKYSGSILTRPGIIVDAGPGWIQIGEFVIGLAVATVEIREPPRPQPPPEVLLCRDCGAIFDDNEIGRAAVWSHCCQTTHEEDDGV